MRCRRRRRPARTTPLAESRPAYVIADSTSGRQFPVGGDQLRELAPDARDLGYRIVEDQDGYLLLAAP